VIGEDVVIDGATLGGVHECVGTLDCGCVCVLERNLPLFRSKHVH